MKNQQIAPSSVPQLPKTLGKETATYKFLKAGAIVAYVAVLLLQIFETYDHGIKTSNMIAGLVWGLILWTPPFIILWRFISSRVEITQQGVTIYRIRRKQFVSWQDIDGIGWRPGSALGIKVTNGPPTASLILKDGSTRSINIVMHATWSIFMGRPTMIVLATDPRNVAIMQDLNAMLRIHNPQAASKAVNQDDAEAMQAKDVTMMMTGQITPEQIQEITEEFHTSKIVRYGGGLLVLFWVFAIVGLIGLIGIAISAAAIAAIFIINKWYNRTKSPVAWNLLRTLIVALIGVMVALTYGHNR